MTLPSTMTRASLALAASLLLTSRAPVDAAATCDVGGVTIGSNVRFVTGGHGVEGSIYAQCFDGQPRCFQDNRVRDHHEGEEVACDDATINASRRKLGVYLSDSVKYWPEGVACYAFASTFTAEQQGVFQQAMNEYHTKTNTKFVTLGECAATYGSNPNVCGGCTQAFQIVNKGGPSDCYATLGYAPNQRMDLNFGPICFGGDGGFRVAVHELGHVLGLIHEHTHPSRAVVVLRDSLTLSADNYMKETDGLTTSYDVNSIMHYGRETGLCIPLDRTKTYCDIDQTAADGCVEPTTAMCDASADNSFGRAPGLSATDIATLARMYGSGAGATPAPATTPAPTAAPTTASPVPVPPAPAPTPAPMPVPSADVPTITPVPVPAPTTVAPAPTTAAPLTAPASTGAPEPTTPEPMTPEPATPATEAPAPTPMTDNQTSNQQSDADPDSSFHQFMNGDANATEGEANANAVAGDADETASAASRPLGLAQAAATVESRSVKDVPEAQASAPILPTQPKGNLCH